MEPKYETTRIVSDTKIFGLARVPICPLGHYRSAPAEMGSACTPNTTRTPHRRQHPATMSSTVEVGVAPKVPDNASNLVTEYPHESPVDRPADSVA
jgi:hypothetical protein